MALIATLTGWLPSAHAQSPLSLEVAAVDPDNAGQITLNHNLSLKVHFTSSVPIRLTAEGRFQGRVVQDLSNASPVYPPGVGDALVWISYRQPTQIDEVLVHAFDENFKPLTTLAVPISVEWATNVPMQTVAPWVRSTAAEQTRLISQAVRVNASGFDLFGTALFAFLYLSILGYPFLQAYSLWKDGWFGLAGVPLLLMIPLFIHAGSALMAGSNLWPLLLLFGAPFAFGYLIILRIWRWKSKRSALRA